MKAEERKKEIPTWSGQTTNLHCVNWGMQDSHWRKLESRTLEAQFHVLLWAPWVGDSCAPGRLFLMTKSNTPSCICGIQSYTHRECDHLMKARSISITIPTSCILTLSFLLTTADMNMNLNSTREKSPCCKKKEEKYNLRYIRKQNLHSCNSFPMYHMKTYL